MGRREWARELGERRVRERDEVAARKEEVCMF